MKLSGVTFELGNAYRVWKAAESRKDKARREFFEQATEALRGAQDEPERKLVTVYGPTKEEALDRVVRYYPTWEPSTVGPEVDGNFEILLDRNPEYMDYTYVNLDDEMVYARQVPAGKLQFDDELLKERDPELYKRVTYVPQERQLKSLDKLSPEDLAAVQEYIYEAKPSPRLAAPRKAKPEELPMEEAVVS